MNGLVLEGGGMRGLYTAGVLDAFLDAGIAFDYVIGVSAGACNAVSYLTGQRGRNYHVNIDYINDKRYMSVQNFLKDGCLFSEEMMFHKIPKELIPFDYEAFRQSKVSFVACCTSCLTGKPVYHRVDDLEADYKPVLASMSLPLVSKMVSYHGDLLLDGCTSCLTGKPVYHRVDDLEADYKPVLASMSLPLVSKMVSYHGDLLLDGGMADPIPAEKALHDGCDKLVAVLTREKGYRKSPESTLKLAKVFYRKYPKLVKAIADRHILYNAQLDLCRKLEEEGRAIVINPDEKVSIKRTEKDVQKLDALYHLGYKDAKRQADAIKVFLK